ncbi:MAG: mucoidy inhibitor MuiA family protein, partial [Bacteroidota bacterium]
TGELWLTLEAESAHDEQLEISYYTKQASWIPTYDFRIEDVNSPMEATCIANVFQQTGEDWKDVMVRVSTANPKVSTRAPLMRTWRIDGSSRLPFSSEENSKPTISSENWNKSEFTGATGMVTGFVVSEAGEGIPGVNVVVEGRRLGAITDIDGQFSINVPSGQMTLEFSFIGLMTTHRVVRGGEQITVQMEEDVETLSEVVVTGYGATSQVGNESYLSAPPKPKVPTVILESNINLVSKATDFEFSIKSPQSILSQSEKKSIDLLTYELDASYRYLCYPRYDKHAFLYAYVPDWEQLNLLTGEVNLFYEGVYKGKTLLDIDMQSDTLEISMGVDESIKVEMEDQVKVGERQAILKRKRQFDWHYDIVNLKDQAVEISVQDQLPVSYNKQISVDLLEMGSGEYDPSNGFVSWVIKLAPKERTQERLAYEVSYSKNVQVRFN